MHQCTKKIDNIKKMFSNDLSQGTRVDDCYSGAHPASEHGNVPWILRNDIKVMCMLTVGVWRHFSTWRVEFDRSLHQRMPTTHTTISHFRSRWRAGTPISIAIPLKPHFLRNNQRSSFSFKVTFFRCWSSTIIFQKMEIYHDAWCMDDDWMRVIWGQWVMRALDKYPREGAEGGVTSCSL